VDEHVLKNIKLENGAIFFFVFGHSWLCLWSIFAQDTFGREPTRIVIILNILKILDNASPFWYESQRMDLECRLKTRVSMLGVHDDSVDQSVDALTDPFLR
jgi:hypothetical protein